ncbi:ABC transporter permease [Leekyejoonella antrihumi]|uniref:ABC transporter permease n=1 Tax=Leekyejoonella antrihumi TaxID=1660198 RepID=A0A563DT73_9MICO|nr:ABC transporter permease [Leekyejoonella antrihumi]
MPEGEQQVPQENAAAKSTLWELFRSDHPAVVTVLSIFAALVVGAVLIVISDQPTRDAAKYFFSAPGDTFSFGWKAISQAYAALFQGAILDPSALSSGSASKILGPLSETLVAATPLILAGLSVTLAFRVGLFNIGAQGQMLIAAIFSGYIGFAWHLPVVIHLLIAVIGGIVGGALWGGIAGWLKAKTGAHEVITTIMLNYVAIGIINYLLGVHGFQAKPYQNAISPPIDGNARFWLLPFGLGNNLRVNASFIVAILATFFVWWLLTRSTIGFRFRAVGANQNAAKTAGMSISRAYITAMLIVGALAGLAGAAQVLGPNGAVTADADAGMGFDAITVALLGRGSAVGTFWAGLLFGALRAGGVQMLASTSTPQDLVQIIQSLIVLFIAAPGLVRLVFRLRQTDHGGMAVEAKGWNG